MKNVQTHFHDVQRPSRRCLHRYFMRLPAAMIALRFCTNISQQSPVFALGIISQEIGDVTAGFGQQIACLSLQSKRINISKMRNFNNDTSQLCTKGMYEQYRVICKKPLILLYTRMASIHKSFQTKFFIFNFS